MNRLAKNIIKNEDGQILVLFALLMVALMGFSALIIDGGMLQMTKADLQKACDAAALAGGQILPDASSAISTAKNYAALNGVEPANTTVTTPYDGDPNKIEVVCTRNVAFSFAGVLGFTEGDISARAVAQKSSMGGGSFDYTLFSGDPNFTLTLNGANTVIGGNAHSNGAFTMNGAQHEVIGSAEAITTLLINGSHLTITETAQAETITVNGSHINIGNEVESAAPWIDMPDFSDMIQAEAESAGEAYSGNVTYNGSYITVDDPIYIDGNLTVNGSHFTGTGVILVSGNIIFNGSNLKSSGSSICFYSENGNIIVNGANIDLEGVIYAPNGTIVMNGANQTVDGRLIANRVSLNGSGYEITSSSDDLNFLPSSGVMLVE